MHGTTPFPVSITAICQIGINNVKNCLLVYIVKSNKTAEGRQKAIIANGL